MTLRRVTREYTCHAQLELFTLEWEELPEAWQRAIMDQGSLPCEGGGGMGDWCTHTSEGFDSCVWFGGVEEWED